MPPIRATRIQTTSLRLTDDLEKAKERFSFTSRTNKDPAANRIVPPSMQDPPLGVLRIFNAVTLLEIRDMFLESSGWQRLGSPAKFKGWRYEGKRVGDLQVKSVTLKPDALTAKGTGGFTLDEIQQGRIGLQLVFVFPDDSFFMWCAEAPAKTAANPGTTTKYDRPGLFVAQPKSPPPAICQ